MDIHQKTAIITRQICMTRRERSPPDGYNPRLAQPGVYLPTHQRSVFPDRLLILRMYSKSAPHCPPSSSSYGRITVLVKSASSRSKLSPPFPVPKVIGAIFFMRPSPSNTSHSHQCLLFHSDKGDSFEVLSCQCSC